MIFFKGYPEVSRYLQAQELERFKQDEENLPKLSSDDIPKIAKSKNINSNSETAQWLRTQIQRTTEMKRDKGEEKHRVVQSIKSNFTYKMYTIEEIEAATNFFCKTSMIGEGGYGPVYKGFLDHTPVAIRILHPDVAQEMSQFQQEVSSVFGKVENGLHFLLVYC